jgi:Flp pilus assembly protein TadB
MERAVIFLREIVVDWRLDYITVAANIAMGLTIVFILLAIRRVRKSEEIHNRYVAASGKSKEAMNNSLKRMKFKSLSYHKTREWMQKSGFNYMTNNKVSVLGYLGMRVALMILAMVVGFKISIIGGVVGAVIGWLALDFIINMSDASDNKKMLEDIKALYDTLRIQTKAGVYITSVLTECYLVVQNKRLKQALLELTSDLKAKNDLELALSDFSDKFRNEYITKLQIVIKQSLKTGRASEMFEDIRKQIETIDLAIMTAEQQRVKGMIVFVQLLIYGAVIIVAIYVAMTGLSDNLSF